VGGNKSIINNNLMSLGIETTGLEQQKQDCEAHQKTSIVEELKELEQWKAFSRSGRFT